MSPVLVFSARLVLKFLFIVRLLSAFLASDSISLMASNNRMLKQHTQKIKEPQNKQLKF